MKRDFLVACILLIISSLLIITSANGTTYFNKDGNAIDSTAYEQGIRAQKSATAHIEKEGYAEAVVGFEDPILLRKKRIEQWKEYRKSLSRRMR